jgi:glycosyltransferase involved in cell wall biosynthesis
MVILTNFERFPLRWRSKDGIEGESQVVRSADEMLQAAKQKPDAIILVNGDTRLTFQLASRLLFAARPAVVSVDLILRRPRSIRAAVLQHWKRFLLRRVDHFIHYFSDLRGYERFFGIGPDRSSFTPFKANLADHGFPPGSTEGEYILCLGRTLRDYDTFFTAVEQLPYPAAIARPNIELMREHGARFTRAMGYLPKNVCVLEDNGSDEAMANLLRKAKIVVVPILKESMAASGCSTCLNAMWFGKPVIGTEGPGFSDIFHDGEALWIPAEDPAALRDTIRHVQENNALRKQLALAGHRYGLAAGGEQELFQRIIDRVALWYRTEYLLRRR